MVYVASSIDSQNGDVSRLGSSGRMISVLLADDHVLFRQALRYLLEAEPDLQVLDEAGDGDSILQLAAQVSPDVILMDISMPNTDTFEVVRMLKSRWPNVKLIILTMSNDESYIVQAVRSGADAYLLKNSESKIVMEAIRAVFRGESVIDPQLATSLLSGLRRMSGFEPDRKHGGISTREIELLQLIARGLSNKQIGHELNLAESTIKNRLSVLFEKLKVKDRTQAAIYAMSNGLIDRPA